ncbi:uncharacterized protein LOC132695642 [Cylas formicarius]|uniref:uncharacterized protein LOC132695642 n=1 Tax=Cylas formicarius TaxID=197179 RepID=UPI002958AA34|nr:uncharacterized protein LOC132695642 [Cylas formicarius]
MRRNSRVSLTPFSTDNTMISFFGFVIFISICSAHAQDPRKRIILDVSGDMLPTCAEHLCMKRSGSQNELGPFWANRGKKDPKYLQEKFFVDEPRWILIHKDYDPMPFYTTRGKKRSNTLYDNFQDRQRRVYADDESDVAFFAARGKKFIEKI